MVKIQQPTLRGVMLRGQNSGGFARPSGCAMLATTPSRASVLPGVAQIGNLLFRRLAVGGRADFQFATQPTASRRYDPAAFRRARLSHYNSISILWT
jgi:hypothetical protein